jgi:DNA-binding SARP family transcriptional activator
MAQPAMCTELRLELLGPARITRGGAPLSFARRKALALLAYLVLTGRPHSREALASLLTGEGSDDAHAHATCCARGVPTDRAARRTLS